MSALSKDELARRLALRLLSRLGEGQLTIHDRAGSVVLGAGTPQATVRINSSRAWPLLLRGSRGLGQAYMEGLWDSPDLVALIRLAARNARGLDEWRRRLAALRVPAQTLRGLRKPNTPGRSRRDIAAHYDLGNQLFELMLDETMTYSCAYFPDEHASLAEASTAKFELVCQKLDLSAEDHVLEIGTGWGGFAIHAAATRGCRVTTTTISAEQYELARARVQAAGVSDRVTVLASDYRDLSGRYDKLVSIEMIEAIGWRDFGTFFARCSDLLHPQGAMLLQAIVIDDRAYEVEKASASFIRTFVFPGGCLPSLEVISRGLARHTDLRMVGLEDLTDHYPRTLRTWRANFEAQTERLEALGYDERFRRLWRLYLAYCEAGFAERRIGVVQALLAKPRWRQPGLRPGTAPGPRSVLRPQSLAAAGV